MSETPLLYFSVGRREERCTVPIDELEGILSCKPDKVLRAGTRPPSNPGYAERPVSSATVWSVTTEGVFTSNLFAEHSQHLRNRLSVSSTFRSFVQQYDLDVSVVFVVWVALDGSPVEIALPAEEVRFWSSLGAEVHIDDYPC